MNFSFLCFCLQSSRVTGYIPSHSVSGEQWTELSVLCTLSHCPMHRATTPALHCSSNHSVQPRKPWLMASEHLENSRSSALNKKSCRQGAYFFLGETCGRHNLGCGVLMALAGDRGGQRCPLRRKGTGGAKLGVLQLAPSKENFSVVKECCLRL